MPLPTSRDVTLAPNSQVPSSLLNNLQDQVIAMRGERRHLVSAMAGRAEIEGDVLIGGVGSTSFYLYNNVAGARRVMLPVPVKAAERIKSWKAHVYSGTSQTIDARLIATRATDGQEQLGESYVTSTASGYRSIDKAYGTPTVAAAGIFYLVEVVLNNINQRLYGLELVTDWP